MARGQFGGGRVIRDAGPSQVSRAGRSLSDTRRLHALSFDHAGIWRPMSVCRAGSVIMHRQAGTPTRQPASISHQVRAPCDASGADLDRPGVWPRYHFSPAQTKVGAAFRASNLAGGPGPSHGSLAPPAPPAPGISGGCLQAWMRSRDISAVGPRACGRPEARVEKVQAGLGALKPATRLWPTPGPP